MINKLKLIALIFSVLTINGCIATQANMVKPNYLHSEGIGYFVVSVTHDGTGDSTLLYREKGATEYTRIDSVGVFAAKSDFDSKHPPGRVIAVAVPPGEYEISGFGLFSSRKVSWDFAQELPPLKFNVRDSESVYLGSMHVSRLNGISEMIRNDIQVPGLTVQNTVIFGLTRAAGANGLFYDGSDRDITIYKDKYKNLLEIPLKINPLSATEWNGKHVVQ